MKKHLSILFISLLSYSAFSQSISIEDADGNDVTNTTINIIGHPSEETITTQFSVFNGNDSSLTIDAIRTEDECISGSGEFFCWTLCLTSEECGTTYERGMPFALGVDGNSYSSLPLIVDFEPSFNSDEDGLEGDACYTYRLFDVNNESDSSFVKVCYTIDYAIGINEYDNSALSTVYPNPANDQISIRMNTLIEKASFEVYSLVGNRVEVSQISSNNGVVKIDISSLPNGVYMLTEVQSQITRRFIVSR